jgi:hypothetical protein
MASNNSVQLGRHVFLNVFSALKPLSFGSVFTVGKRKKSADARSGEQGGWLNSTAPRLARNFFTMSAEWEGALSCNKNKLPSARICGLAQEMRFQNLPITSMQKALLTICPLGTIFFLQIFHQHGFHLRLLQTKLFGP